MDYSRTRAALAAGWTRSHKDEAITITKAVDMRNYARTMVTISTRWHAIGKDWEDFAQKVYLQNGGVNDDVLIIDTIAQMVHAAGEAEELKLPVLPEKPEEDADTAKTKKPKGRKSGRPRKGTSPAGVEETKAE